MRVDYDGLHLDTPRVLHNNSVAFCACVSVKSSNSIDKIITNQTSDKITMRSLYYAKSQLSQ